MFFHPQPYYKADKVLLPAIPINFTAGLRDLWQLCLTFASQTGIVTCQYGPSSSRASLSTNGCIPGCLWRAGKLPALVQGRTK